MPRLSSSALAVLVLGTSLPVLASTITVPSTAVIFAAGTQSGSAAGDGGIAPVSISLGTGVTSFTFATSGTITLNNGTGNNVNDADGAHSAVGTGYSFTNSVGSISGITAPGAGYLVGVFLASGGPGTSAAPASLSFTTTSFTSLSPLLDQVFFIGDGLTGDGTGATQLFNVPTGAATLYLGLSDACGYAGSPSCYADNLGSYTVNYTSTGGGTTTPPSAVPEPSSLLLLGTGTLTTLGALRRRLSR